MIAMFRSVPRTLAGFAFAFLAFAGAAHAIDIQRVDSPRGIEAWLVEDHSVPLVAMSFAFRGGASQDPDGKPGVANMLSGLLDEGAGDLDSAAFQARLDALSIGLSFDAGRDTFEGSLVTLAENRAEATRLLHLALTAPRLDEEPVARIRDQILLQLKRSAQSPGRLAGEALMKATFPDHPYGRPVRGTEESVAAITVDDLQGFRLKTFTRDSVKVAIVGDNRPRLYWTMTAVQAIGAVPVPLYQDSVAEEMTYVLEHAEARFAVVQDQLASCLTDVERMTIPRASHAMHAGNPEAYNETVLAFLAQH